MSERLIAQSGLHLKSLKFGSPLWITYLLVIVIMWQQQFYSCLLWIHATIWVIESVFFFPQICEVGGLASQKRTYPNLAIEVRGGSSRLWVSFYNLVTCWKLFSKDGNCKFLFWPIFFPKDIGFYFWGPISLNVRVHLGLLLFQVSFPFRCLICFLRQVRALEHNLFLYCFVTCEGSFKLILFVRFFFLSLYASCDGGGFGT